MVLLLGRSVGTVWIDQCCQEFIGEARVWERTCGRPYFGNLLVDGVNAKGWKAKGSSRCKKVHPCKCRGDVYRVQHVSINQQTCSSVARLSLSVFACIFDVYDGVLQKV